MKALFPIAALIVVGCSKGTPTADNRSIVGTWLTDSARGDTGIGFNPDGSYRSWYVDGTSQPTAQGIYNRQGDQLTLSVGEQRNGGDSGFRGNPFPDGTCRLVWDSDDHLKLMKPNGSISLSRKLN